MKLMVLLVLALAVSAVPLQAQDGTIALYFTEDGLNYSRYVDFSDFTIEAYVIVYVEDIVTGALYRLEMDGIDVMVISETYTPGSIVIGDMLSGVAVSLPFPESGFGGEPVFVGTVTFLNLAAPGVPEVDFQIVPHPTQGTPVYSDASFLMQPLTGLSSGIGVGAGVPDTDHEFTWGRVKSLYR